MKKTKSQNLSLDINSSFIVYISSEVDGWEFWKPSELRRKYLAGTLENFDFVFTYSSLEHSGLGKTFRLSHFDLIPSSLPKDGTGTP